MYPYQNYYQQPVQQPVIQQPIQQPIQQANQQPIQQQPIQNGGFVIVQDENEITRYPVAHGNIVTFRIENQPVVVEKSLGYSQFDPPHYERYRLIKEDMPVPEAKEYLLKNDFQNAFDGLRSEIDDLKSQIGTLCSKNEKTTTRKKEVE